MDNYFGGTEGDSLIIAKPEILAPDYLPEEVLNRSAELQTIADAIKPLLRKKEMNNLFIYGKSGTGKTVSIRFLIKQLREHSPNIIPVYVNCWENYTQMAVYNRINEEIKLPMPRRGLATDEIFDRIVQYVKNYKKPILLILDEMDGLRHKELLYVVARANEKSGVRFGIIGISNNSDLLSGLDARTRSSIHFSTMEFKHYSEEQLIEIIKHRADEALVPGSFDGRLLEKIASETEEKNARIAIHSLRKAAEYAENQGRTRITLQDLADSANETDHSELHVSEEEQEILDVLKKGEMKSSELYDALEINKTKRQIRNYLELLEKKNLIEIEEIPGTGLIKSKKYRLK